jgi:hypothetical protein
MRLKTYRGLVIDPWMADLILCCHCGNPRTPKGLCDGCGSFAMKVVKVSKLERDGLLTFRYPGGRR